ncbi:diacylglycerol kinase [Vibrio sp. SCSIO 43137]|uniref:diacylglycerol kinase n=1 Tax=Vibrio sp. SCSIO 43137 TaxID=3021011 RepID=UPI0023079626|nr:diacylglycerol kinase [Vibrio sp. SCSIO 43137]WCE29841.1 diacylglycerol kinase [Vibrio sp. SCSIO 43137]
MPSENSGKPGNTGITRIIKATGYSIQGLKAAWKHEAAIRQELVLLLIALPVIVLVDVSLLSKLVMLSGLVLLLVVELINSAIEAIVDRVGTEHHELSGRAKDIGSAAVMVTLLLNGVNWFVILSDRYLF